MKEKVYQLGVNSMIGATGSWLKLDTTIRDLMPWLSSSPLKTSCRS